MTDHVTQIRSHMCRRGAACETKLEVHCTCGFGQGASTDKHAEAIAAGHPQRPTDPVIRWQPALTGSTITDDQLHDLFARHCACRPLDLHRTAEDHAAIHDCDTGILHDVQVALYIVRFDDIGRGQAIREARQRCAEIINASRSHVA